MDGIIIGNGLIYQHPNEYDIIQEDKENYVDKICELNSNHLNQIGKKRKQIRSKKTNEEISYNLNISDENNTQKNDMLTKKRENTSTEKSNEINSINNEYISYIKNGIKHVTFFLITGSKNYQTNKRYLSITKNQINIGIKYGTNLDWIKKKLQDIISYKDEKIKIFIDKIIENSDYPPLKEFFNEYIKDLLLCFSCNELNDNKVIYKSELKKFYHALIKKLKNKGKSPEYIEHFEKFIYDIAKG